MCFNCGEKWNGRQHQCPTQVPIHDIQKSLDVLPVQEPKEEHLGPEEDFEDEQIVLAIQQPAPIAFIHA